MLALITGMARIAMANSRLLVAKSLSRAFSGTYMPRVTRVSIAVAELNRIACERDYVQIPGSGPPASHGIGM